MDSFFYAADAGAMQNEKNLGLPSFVHAKVMFMPSYRKERIVWLVQD